MSTPLATRPHEIPLRWLGAPGATTWGAPWPRGVVADIADVSLEASDAGASSRLPLQSWPLATWPDGSLKWTGHAMPALAPHLAEAALTLLADSPSPTTQSPQVDSPVSVINHGDALELRSGTTTWHLPGSGEQLVSSATITGPDGKQRAILGPLTLVGLVQEAPDDDVTRYPRHQLSGVIDSVAVEQSGGVRAVIRLDGHYRSASSSYSWPQAGESVAFVVRLIALAGESSLRLHHTVVLDADSSSLHLAGIGVRAAVVLRDDPYNRHVRLAGPQREDGGYGFLSEAVQGVTGLRRDPGEEIRTAQVHGRDTGPSADFLEPVATRMHWVPTWSDWRLEQHSCDGFTLAKRTASDASWVGIPGGTRAGGFAYLGGISGGAALGVRDFWRSHPDRLDISGAAGEIGSTGSITAWLWSPSAPAMDLRPYHDGLGQDGYADQLDALEITYEDWEEGYNTPRGIARTHELTVFAFPATPDQEVLSRLAQTVQDPPLLQATPQALHRAGVFGDWSLPDRSTPARADVEDRLIFLRDFYLGQVEQRRWYGFWDTGDVMHTYDSDRHQWRYDVGGYAWDNSELSPDLWLWYDAIRSGRSDVFRLAERMTRHTGDVDSYHAGPWQGLGTRHNVQHWGCSAKQLRISNAAYRRFLYYLTADERIGDLLAETSDSERALLAIDATRKVRNDVYSPDERALAIGLGTDWGALLAAWLTAWERTGEDRFRDKVLGTMADVAALAQGFFTGEALLDLETGRFATDRDRVTVSHLSSVFGLVEVCAELVALTEGTEHEVPGFADAWLRYCVFYGATPAEQATEFGHPLKGISLVQAHSRLTAWAARRTADPELARRAVRAFLRDENDQLNSNMLQRERDWVITRVTDGTVLTPVDEAAFVSTNDAAQYGLAAIQLLALVPDALDALDGN